MSDEAFQKLKLTYMGVLKDMNEGNAEILNQLSELSGVDMSSLMGDLQSSQSMLAGIANVNVAPVNESLGVIPENANTATSSINDTMEEAKQQISTVTKSLNDLTNDVANYQLPELNTEQFTASLGTADGTSGVLGQLNTFVMRYREICDTIPQIWRDTMSLISGTQGSASGESTDYNSLFAPMLTAMDNAKFQIDEKLKSYADAWTMFNSDLGGIIGVSGGDGGKGKDGKGKLAPAAKAFGGNTGKGSEGKGSEGGTDTIVGSIQTGGQMIADTFDNEWIPSFASMGQNINDICRKVVLSVNEMAEETVEACRAAIEAINKMNAAKASGSANNPTPSDFKGSIYVGQSFASGTDLVHKNQKAVVNEIGEEGLIRDGKLHKITGGIQLLDLKRGDMILNHEQMNQLENGKKVTADGGHAKVYNGFANGTLKRMSESTILKPEIVEQLMKEATLPFQQFTPQRIDYNAIPKGGNKTEINIGDIKVEGVQDTMKFAKDIVSKMPNQVLQEMYRR